MTRTLDPLVTTKLRPSQARTNLIVRPRLTEKLEPEPGCRLTLVSAPAGFGKTTLLGEWLAGPPSGERAVAWISLDEGDNDPARFLSYLVAALRTVEEGIGAGVLAALRSPEPPRIEAVAGALLNEMAAFPGELVVVLDDYHAIENPALHEGVAFLLDNLPQQVHLIISGRTDPPLPLSRLRARGQMTELGAADLSFTSEEAAAFLKDVMGLELSAEDVAALEERTEGWIAGLQLAALSMRDRKDVSGFIESFSGSHRDVFDFLAEEVLYRQPENMREFLLETSILDRLTGELCDTVTAHSDGQAMLGRLERENLFLISLDNERRWYRYHHLFSDFLRSRLERESPERAGMLHARASGWYERAGWKAEAIGHALSTSDHERAARLVEEEAGAVWQRGEVATLSGWLQTLSEEAKRRRPGLFQEQATVLMWGGLLEGIEPLLQKAEEAVRGAEECFAEGYPGANGRAHRRLLGRTAAIRSWCARHLVDARGSVEFAHRALALLPEDDFDLRSFATLCLGAAHWGAADLGAASMAYAESAKLGRTARNDHMALKATQDRARIQIERGQLRVAEEVLREALGFAEERGCASLPAAGLVQEAIGELLYERNELDAAERWLTEGVRLVVRTGEIIFSIRGHVALSRAKWARGDGDGALAAAREASKLAQESGLGRAVVEAATWKARLHLARGESSLAAFEQERATDAGELAPTAREYERVGLARLLLARDAPEEAARLLEQAREAAEAAGRVGNAIGITALEAVALRAQGDKVRAANTLAQALCLAEPEGYVRTFVDEGAVMAALLSGVLEGQQEGRSEPPDHVSPHYLRKLLSALEGDAGHAAASAAKLSVPLTERELKVLALIADGKTDRQVAGELFVAPSTVKTHLKNVYRKLGARGRVQAASRARELGLI